MRSVAVYVLLQGAVGVRKQSREARTADLTAARGNINEMHSAAETFLPFCEEIASMNTIEVTALVKGADTPFTPEEMKTTAEVLKFNSATCSKEPKAVWVLGPSASGKSTVTTMISKIIDFPMIESGEDAVVLDGDEVRNQHKGYMALVAFGLRNNCIFKKAWPAVQPHVKHAKAEILAMATTTDCQRNLLIPETCSKWNVCAKELSRLKRDGYTIDVAAIYGPHDAIELRGRKRADQSGKVYSAGNFVASIVAMVPMMGIANGRCMLVNNTVLPPNFTVNTPCPSQDVVGVTPPFAKLEAEAYNGTGMDPDIFRAAKKEMGLVDA